MRKTLIGLVAVLSMACSGHRAETWNTKGRELSAAGKYVEAIAAYGHAVELDPRMGKAHYNMGLNYLRLRQPDQAAACFRHALEIDPADVDASRYLTMSQAAIQSRGVAYMPQ